MSDSNTYADLEIRILEKQERGHPVEITFNGDQEFPRGFLGPTVQPQIERAYPQESGERLFRWLFASGELQAAWAQARGSRPPRRIRLRIDATAPELHAAARELLRDPGSGSAPQDLAAMEATPFSRYFGRPVDPRRPILKRPIRILVAIASPTDLEEKGLSAIDPNEEWELVQKAVAGAPNVQAVRLPEPRQLMDAGAASDDKLRLVFLSSCKTAVRSPADAFRGLAPKLVASGVPARALGTPRQAESTLASVRSRSVPTVPG